MHFPLLPLVGVLSGLQEGNVALSLVVVIVTLVVGFVILAINASTVPRYDKGMARTGLCFLGTALAVSVFGVIYPLSVLVVGFLLYHFFWTFVWKVLIQNIIASLSKH